MKKLIDTSCSIETPEGIDFSSTIAGPIPRTLAYAIDLGWRCLIYLGIGLVTIFTGNVGVGFFLVITFLLEWFYPVFFEVFRHGQTPGKKALGLRVVNEDYTPVNWSGSTIRNLLRSADFLPVFYLFGITSITLSKKFQRLGDMAAGTVVIYTPQKTNNLLDNEITPTAPSQPLTPQEKQAISNFTLRTSSISEARQVELTNLLEPITKSTGPEGLNLVKSIGAWLLGKK